MTPAPLWDRIGGELDRLRAGQEELNAKAEELPAGQEELRTEQSAIRAELTTFQVETDLNLKKIDRKFEQVFGGLGTPNARVGILEDRMDKIAPEA